MCTDMPNKLLALLFPPALLNVMSVSTAQNTLTFLACGGILKHKRPLEEVKEFMKRYTLSAFHV
jgi:hypothetical protein